MALLSDSLYCVTRVIAGKMAAEDDEEGGKNKNKNNSGKVVVSPPGCGCCPKPEKLLG